MARPDSPRLFHLPRAWHAQCPLGSTFQPHRVCVCPSPGFGCRPGAVRRCACGLGVVSLSSLECAILHLRGIHRLDAGHSRIRVPQVLSHFALESATTRLLAVAAGLSVIFPRRHPCFGFCFFLRLARVYLVFFPKYGITCILWSALFRLFGLKIMFVPLLQLAQRVYD